MYQQNAIAQMMSAPDRRKTAQTGNVERLTTNNEAEVLEFLSERPIHTVAMMGFIRDNGIVSPLNRGIFWPTEIKTANSRASLSLATQHSWKRVVNVLWRPLRK